MSNSDEWTLVIQEVSDRHKRGEINGAEYHAFTEIVDRARNKGWTPEAVGFDPQSFEESLTEKTNDQGLVQLSYW